MRPRCTCGLLLSPVRQFSSSPVSRAKPKKRKPSWDAAKWRPKIGLEMHVQLKGNLKLFSPTLAVHNAIPNTRVSFYDAALPGTLPVLQPKAVTTALLACLALKADINQRSTFDRKHYFYPDLPAGYQITQKFSPLARGGYLRVKHEDRDFRVRIQQIQLEQDTAKSFHDAALDKTLIDLNRAGAALVEIVTEPDLESPEDAALFLRFLQAALRHVGASDADMDKGQLRCDANVSVSHVRQPIGGTRSEIKNLNSIRSVEEALEFEIVRHISAYESGVSIEQATRGFDPSTAETYHLRSKEDAPDYRFMPDPELGPIVITSAKVEQLKKTLPELPLDAVERLIKGYGIRRREANVVVALGESLVGSSGEEGGAAVRADLGITYFEEVAKHCTPKVAVNWMVNELLGRLAKNGYTLATSPIKADQLGRLIAVMERRGLTATQGKQILTDAVDGTLQPDLETTLSSFVAVDGVDVGPSHQLTTFDATEICLDVIESMPVEVVKVRAGKKKVIKRLVGEVMRRSEGKADPIVASKYLETLLLPQ